MATSSAVAAIKDKRLNQAMEAESISIMFADISKRPKPTYPWTSFGL
jgi:hypothetical protein